MNDFTFLSVEQIFENNSLDIIKKYGAECTITDFSILLGGAVDHTQNNGTGLWWTETAAPYFGTVCTVTSDGNHSWNSATYRGIGARPALPYSAVSSICSNKVRGMSGILEVQYGEYPQSIADENVSCELEKAYMDGVLRATGKTYTTDFTRYEDRDRTFQERKHIEYEYNGSKYIRFVADGNCDLEVLSDGRMIRSGSAYWVRVEPITWLVDEQADIALSKNILFSGVQFQNGEQYDGDFDKTNIKWFMDHYFSKEIVSDHVYLESSSIQEELGNEELVKKQNPYDFNFDHVSEEDIIRGAVESNVSVFLHGRSSEGKSARVKQLDPDCEIIYMRNATPDSLNGKSVYNASTGEMIDIPPTWYSRLLKKCEAEPDKIHILFFDELTNALPSIQGMAFNIILDGEVNGKWRLPPNARIVAAGNDLNDSLAANQMAEPLFNRFAHVYIQTTVDSWLKWASTPKEKYERLDYREEEKNAKIHPSIYAYVACKSYSGQDVLRTPYTGEKPNADPRKWEMASKVLYKTKQPDMLRALIGEELTADFKAFTSIRVIGVEDVINHNYSSKDLEMDVSQKFATAVALSSVDEKHFMVVRDFMKQVGEEPKSAFESMWTHGDENRLEYLAAIQMTDHLKEGEIKR